MTKFSKGAKSKRIGTKLKASIRKRCAESRRRLKKEARKLAALGIKTRPSKSKEFHIPNLYPYKKKMIEHLKNSKQTAEKRRMLVRLMKKRGDHNMEVIREDPEARVAAYLKKDAQKKKRVTHTKKHYMKELRNVIDTSDIIIEVLDARDPMACRNKEMEAEVLGTGQGKKIILVLNKIDLVPM